MTRPSAILFDLDGTLTRPMLDFPRIKQEMGIGQQPILEALAAMDAAARGAAEAILERHEFEAAAGSTLNPGCVEVLDLLREHRIPTAIITRNSRRSARTVLERHGLSFDVLITREDGRFKPNPAPLVEACRRLGVDIRAAWMVGDGQYDVDAALAAGARAIWLSHGRLRPFAAEPWRTVQGLHELTCLLEECLFLRKDRA